MKKTDFIKKRRGMIPPFLPVLASFGLSVSDAHPQSHTPKTVRSKTLILIFFSYVLGGRRTVQRRESLFNTTNSRSSTRRRLNFDNRLYTNYNVQTDVGLDAQQHSIQ